MISQTPSKDLNSLNKTQPKSTNASKQNFDPTKLVTIAKNYVLRKLIYKGKQFNIYIAVNVEEKNKHYIVKMCQIDNESAIDHSEEKILHEIQSDPNIPKYSSFGVERVKGTLYQYQIMQALGPSLKLCFNFTGKKLELTSICIIAIQIINNEKEQLTILERLHNLGIVHRNLRPKKILTSTDMEQHNELYLIDFQNAVKLKKKNGKIFQPQQHPNHYVDRNTLNKFSSLAQHINLVCSPKDDLESLGYILIYLAQNGSLFHLKQYRNREEKMKQYENLKLKLIPEEDFRDVPREIKQYFNFVKMTNINEFPLKDYEFLKKMFRKLLIQQGGNDKSHLEWIGVMKQQSELRSQLYFLSQENTNRNLNSSFQLRLETKRFGKFVSFSADLPKVDVPKIESPKTFKQPTPIVQEIQSEIESDIESVLSDKETDSISNNMKILSQNIFQPKLKNIFKSEYPADEIDNAKNKKILQ